MISNYYKINIKPTFIFDKLARNSKNERKRGNLLKNDMLTMNYYAMSVYMYVYIIIKKLGADNC